MDIKPNEVESVSVVGTLNGDDVKIIKTHGGFHLAVGKKNKKSKKSEVLAGGSHKAIVAHQIQKDYGSDYQPILSKSEHDNLGKIEDKTSYLNSDNIQDGVELYAITKNNKVEFVLYKRGLTLCKYGAEIKSDSLILKNKYFNKSLIKKEMATANAIARAIEDKVYELNLTTIEKKV